MLTYYTLIDAMFLVVIIAMYIDDTTKLSNYHILIEFVALLLHVAVFVLRNRKRKALIGMILSLFTITTLLHILELCLAEIYSKDTSTN